MKKSLIILMFVLMGIGIVWATGNQETKPYPSKTIEIIAPYNPGGDTDFNARAYAEFLKDELNQTVIVSNVSGSGGVVGSRKVKDARPDGYTVLFMHPALLVNELAGSSDYGLNSFEYVCTAGQVPGEIIAVHKNLGFKNLKDLIEYTKINPKTLSIAADIGTMTHIMALQLVEAGADINIVSAGGASARVASLLGGHIDIIINSYGTIADYILSGEIIPLAQTNRTRSKGFPDIVPAIEQGYNVYFDKYYFFAMPKGTPQNIVNTFAQAIKNISKNQKYADMIFKSYRQTPLYKPAKEGLEEMQMIKADIQKYQKNFLN